MVYGEEVDLKVKVTPPKREVGCGEAATVQYNVNIQGLAGSAQLSVDGLPSGVSAAFKENPVTPPGGGSTADTKLVITRTGDTAEGSHTLTISAKAGAAESSDRVTLKTRDCIDPQGSFSLTANPPERTIQASESTDYSVTAAFDAGYSGTVWLSIAGLPKGATALFDPKRLSPSGVKRSQLEIITDGSTPEGSYPLIITGDDGELKRTVTVMLNVVSTVESGFDLYIEPDEVELQPGETGEAEISTDFLGDCTGPIALDINGSSSRYIRDVTGMRDREFEQLDDPDRIAARLMQSELNAEGVNNNDATLEVKVGVDVPPGAYDVVVEGVGGDLCEDEQEVVLTILVGEVPLALEKRQSKSSLTPGMTQVYTLQVRNESRVPVTGLEIKDVLDSRLSYVSDTSGVTPTISGTTYTWSFDDLDADEEIQFKVTTTVSDFLRAGARISNDFELMVDQGTEPINSNTVTAVLGYVSVDPDGLRVDKRKLAGRPGIGGILTYRIEVENTGAGAVFDARVTDDPPPAFKIPDGKTVRDGKAFTDPVYRGGKYTWNLGNLAAGERTVLTYQMVIGTNADSGENKNCAEVEGVDGGGNAVSGSDCAIVNLGDGDVEWLGQITAKAYLDVDGNGIKSADDKPLEGIEFILVGGSFAGLKQSTDDEGETVFAELKSNSYMVALNTRTLSTKYRFDDANHSELVQLLEGEKAEVVFLISSLPVKGFLKINVSVERSKN